MHPAAHSITHSIFSRCITAVGLFSMAIVLSCEAIQTEGLSPPHAITQPRSSSGTSAGSEAIQTLQVSLKTQAITRGEMPVGSSPISMSDPDGQELILEALSVQAAVYGMLSLTELEMVFRNPHSRRMEGRFTCTLPEGAAISRFAKEVGGQLMEGEVVERQRANRIYDQILHEMRDPALLEQDQGNRFSARIFPIEANDSVRLVLSYSKLLPMADKARTFSLPLRGLPQMGRFHFRGVFSALEGEISDDLTGGLSQLSGPAAAQKSVVQVMEIQQTDYTPLHDLSITWRSGQRSPKVQLLQAGEFYLAAFQAPELVRQAARQVKGPWLFYLDTSASSAEGQRHRGKALAALLAAMPPREKVRLFAFDQTVVALASGRAGTLAGKIEGLLERRRYLGGTDLAGALRHMMGELEAVSAAQVVLVTDGVATLGDTAQSALQTTIASFPRSSHLHALVLGPRQDGETLRGLTRGHGRVVTIPFSEGLAEKAATAAERLALPLGPTYGIQDASAEWVFPHQMEDVQAGSEVLVLGRIRGSQEVAVQLTEDGEPVAQVGMAQALPLGTFQPLLEREAYRAYLAYLAEREVAESSPTVREALVNEQLRLSIEKRVMIPRTTMLVLESEADYARFGLDRRALAAILTVGPTGIARLDRAGKDPFAHRIAATSVDPAPAPVKRDDEFKEVAPDGETKPKKSPAKMMMAKEGEMAAPDGVVLGRVAATSARDEILSGEASRMAGSAPPPPMPAQMPASSVPDEAPQARVASRPTRRILQEVRQRRGAATGALSEVVNEPDGAQRGKAEGPAWTRLEPASDAVVHTLKAAIAANPRDRTAYNQLSDAYVAREEFKALRQLGLDWQPFDPENPQVYESLGEAFLSLGLREDAVRAFGSLVEVAPNKPELLQRAALLLLRAEAGALSETPLRRALELNPNRANAHRHLALLLWQQRRYAEASAVLEAALDRSFEDWYGDVHRVMREELGYVLRAWRKAEPGKAAQVKAIARRCGVDVSRMERLRITLAWETDANDVDLHVVDPAGEECYYSHSSTRSGLELYEDITQGFGPEVVRTERLVSGTYHVGVNYFSSGPMGISRGMLVILRPDADGVASHPEILPFRLVEGGNDMRLLAAVHVR